MKAISSKRGSSTHANRMSGLYKGLPLAFPTLTIRCSMLFRVFTQTTFEKIILAVGTLAAGSKHIRGKQETTLF